MTDTLEQDGQPDEDRTDYIAEFMAEYVPGVDRFKDMHLADFLADFIEEHRHGPLVRFAPQTPIVDALGNWPNTSCPKPVSQINKQQPRGRKLPPHKNQSKQCQICGPGEVQTELHLGVARFSDEMYDTDLPNAREADRITNRMSKRPDPGDRVVIRRQDSERVRMLSTKPLTLISGAEDEFPSRKVSKAEALEIFRQAMALPGLAERRSVTWVGSWARVKRPKPSPARTGGGWVTISDSNTKTLQYLRDLAARVLPGVEMEFRRSGSGNYFDVLVSQEVWAALIAAHSDPDTWAAGIGWDDPEQVESSAETTSRDGLTVVATEGEQAEALFAKLPLGQELPLEAAVVNSPQIGDTSPTADVLPAVETSTNTEVDATC